MENRSKSSSKSKSYSSKSHSSHEDDRLEGNSKSGVVAPNEHLEQFGGKIPSGRQGFSQSQKEKERGSFQNRIGPKINTDDSLSSMSLEGSSGTKNQMKPNSSAKFQKELSYPQHSSNGKFASIPEEVNEINDPKALNLIRMLMKEKEDLVEENRRLRVTLSKSDVANAALKERIAGMDDEIRKASMQMRAYEKILKERGQVSVHEQNHFFPETMGMEREETFESSKGKGETRARKDSHEYQKGMNPKAGELAAYKEIIEDVCSVFQVKNIKELPQTVRNVDEMIRVIPQFQKIFDEIMEFLSNNNHLELEINSIDVKSKSLVLTQMI